MTILPSPYAGLTEKQKAFAIEYVSTGGKAELAAKRAGYSNTGEAAHVRANTLLRHPGVLRAIQALCETKTKANVAVATDQLQHLMLNGTAGDGVKLKACKEILDRAGWLVETVSQHRVVVEHQNASARLPSAIIKSLLEGMLSAGVIVIAEKDRWARFLETMDKHAIEYKPAVDAEFSEVDEETPADGEVEWVGE